MSATKALQTNADLTCKLTDAAFNAIKAGMSKDEVAAVLTRLVELLESSDD